MWSSQCVFVGTLFEQLPLLRIEAPEPRLDPLLRPIVTDYLAQVVDSNRGSSEGTIRTGRLCGELDDWSVTNSERQLLKVGQRALFSMRSLEPDSDEPTYHLNG
jgi:hypothetical protein